MSTRQRDKWGECIWVAIRCIRCGGILCVTQYIVVVFVIQISHIITSTNNYQPPQHIGLDRLFPITVEICFDNYLPELNIYWHTYKSITTPIIMFHLFLTCQWIIMKVELYPKHCTLSSQSYRERSKKNWASFPLGVQRCIEWLLQRWFSVLIFCCAKKEQEEEEEEGK